MKKAIRMEFKKLLKARSFWMALIIGICICTIQVVNNWSFVRMANETSAQMLHPNGYDNISLLVRWIGADDYTPYGSCFYLLLPVLAAMPIGASYYNERKNGYMMQVVTRIGNGTYIAAKGIVTFASGMLVAAVPLIWNLMMNALICPLCKVPILTLTTSVGQGSFCSGLFYHTPLLYILAAGILTSVWCGICALSAMVFAMYIKNRVLVTFSPMIAMYVIHFAVIYGKRLLRFTDYELSPVHLMYAACLSPNPTWFVIAYVCVLILILAVICWKRGVKRESI